MTVGVMAGVAALLGAGEVVFVVYASPERDSGNPLVARVTVIRKTRNRSLLERIVSYIFFSFVKWSRV